jgi:hypothetical protein
MRHGHVAMLYLQIGVVYGNFVKLEIASAFLSSSSINAPSCGAHRARFARADSRKALAISNVRQISAQLSNEAAA